MQISPTKGALSLFKPKGCTVDFFLENTTLVILRDFFYGAILWIIKIAFLGLFDQLLEPHS